MAKCPERSIEPEPSISGGAVTANVSSSKSSFQWRYEALGRISTKVGTAKFIFSPLNANPLIY